jgi:hypothetical protein
MSDAISSEPRLQHGMERASACRPELLRARSAAVALALARSSH